MQELAKLRIGVLAGKILACVASIERGGGRGKARQARKIPEILDCRKLAKVRRRTHHNCFQDFETG